MYFPPQGIVTADHVRDLYVNPLSEHVRVAAQKKQVFRQFARPETNYGAHQGTGMKYVKVSNLQNEGRRIGPLAQTPITQLETSTFEVKYQTWANSVALEQQADIVSQLSIGSIYMNALRDDAARTLDRVAADPLVNCKVVYTPTGTYSSKTATMVGTGTPVATQTRPFSIWDLKQLGLYMKNNLSIPAYGNTGHYIMVAAPDVIANLVEDPDFIDRAKFGRPESLFTGEIIDPVYGFRFIEENNVLAPGEAVIFGDDALVELEVYPFELQLGEIGTFGEVKQLRWFWMGGFDTPYNYQTEGQTRVIRIGTA